MSQEQPEDETERHVCIDKEPWRFLAFTILLCLGLPQAYAFDGLTLTIENEGKEYTVNLEARLEAEPDRVFAVLTDYENWDQLSELVTKSEVVGSLDEHRHLVRSVAKACVLMFCGRVVQVQDVVDRDGREIIARTLPERSNVRNGTVRWRVAPDAGSTTQISFYMRLTPDFWIPPLIGPWLVKRSLHRAAVNTVATIENFAGAIGAKPTRPSAASLEKSK